MQKAAFVMLFTLPDWVMYNSTDYTCPAFSVDACLYDYKKQNFQHQRKYKNFKNMCNSGYK